MPLGDSDMEIAQKNTLWRKLIKSETNLNVYHHTPPVEDIPKYSKFTPLAEEETRKLVSSLQNKSCEIDPVPAKVFQMLHE